MFEILKKVKLNNEITLLEIEAPLIAEKVQAGQFIMLRINEFGEKIPLTVADNSQNSITIIFQKIGKTTKLLDTLEIGDKILDITGPLGRPTELEGYKNAIVIGGGLGTAIAYPQIKKLSKFETKVDAILGFRNRDFVILEDKIKKLVNNLTIVTDDGSYNRKALVTDVLKEKIESNKNIDLVVAVGPLLMMKSVCEIIKPFNIKTIVSMNTIMTDGTGMCGGCRLTVDNKIKFACVDGPDFDGHLVNFDEIIIKNRMYTNSEAESNKNFDQSDHICKIRH